MHPSQLHKQLGSPDAQPNPSARMWDAIVRGHWPGTTALLALFLAVFVIAQRLDQLDAERFHAMQANHSTAGSESDQSDQAEWEQRVVAAYKQGVADGKALGMQASADAQALKR